LAIDGVGVVTRNQHWQLFVVVRSIMADEVTGVVL